MAGFNLKSMTEFYQQGKKTKKSGARTLGGRYRDELVREHKGVTYRVWGNRIAHYNPKRETVTVNSSGWRTNLTKNRLNGVIWGSGYISQKNGEWFFNTRNGRRMPYRENMRLKAKRD